MTSHSEPSVCREPITDRSAWRGADLARSEEEWVWNLGDDELDEIDRAVAVAGDRDVLDLRPDDFPLPTLGKRIRQVVDELEHGQGLVVLRGLQYPDRWSDDQVRRIWWAIGQRMGRFIAQNAAGELLGDLVDSGAGQARDARRLRIPARAGSGGGAQGFHTDQTDIVGLLCLRPALHGGASRVASTLEAHNIVLRERPELLGLFYQAWCHDFRNEQPPGGPGWYPSPLFSYTGGVLSGHPHTVLVRRSQRWPDVARLSAEQIQAFDYLDSLFEREGMPLEMMLQPGDMQFLLSHVVVHGRGMFWDDPEVPRRMLRLWISRGSEGRPLCPEYDHWRQGPPHWQERAPGYPR